MKYKIKDDRIKKMAIRENVFTVTWRYGDNWLRNRLNNLRKQGYFTLTSKQGVDYFYPTDKLYEE